MHTFNFGRVDEFLTRYSLVRATRLGVTAPLLPLFAENSPFTSEFFAQRPVSRSFDIFFDPSERRQVVFLC